MQLQIGLEIIQSFLVVAEELNFRRAASRLNLDQSALSRRIQKLESMLGFALFERTTRDVSLTPAGQAFFRDNTHLLVEYTESVDRARLISEGKTGTLRVAYMTLAAPLLMPKAVARFQETHPYIGVSMTKLGTSEQSLALARDEIDVGFLVGPFDHEDFHSLPVSSDPLHVAMPRGHPLAEKSELDATDIDDADLIFYDSSEIYCQRLQEMFGREGVHLSPRYETRHALAVAGLVAEGLGLAIFPGNFRDFFGQNVEWRPFNDPNIAIEVVLVWRRSNRTAALRDFVGIVKSGLGQ